jgi:molybdopterin-binding protein
MKEVEMKFGRGNALRCTIKNICHGAVNTEVVMELDDGQVIQSIISTSSAVDLSLKEGKRVFAVLKASDVMLATD